jgi:hypothetical protein
MYQIYLALLMLLASCSINIQNTFKIFAIKLIYNVIYFYSACQIKCAQVYAHLLPYFKSNTDNTLDTNDKLTIEYFDISANKIIDKDLVTIDEIQNKLIIISNTRILNRGNSSITDKRIVSDIEVIEDPDVSEITFIALYLNYNDMRYNINLKTNDFNYYVVGNIIDKSFVQYYINTVLNLSFSYLESKMATYQLELMDNDVVMTSLTGEQSIIIEKQGYRICNTGL